MKRTRKTTASALIVAVGMLAVLSAMAFTFATIVRVEMETSIAARTEVQTRIMDQWALQQVVEHLKRAPSNGSVITPVDWAGAHWYTRPFIVDTDLTLAQRRNIPENTANEQRHKLSTFDGDILGFTTSTLAAGLFVLEAKVVDCASQVNLVDIDWNNTTSDLVERKIKLLTGLPFGFDPGNNKLTTCPNRGRAVGIGVGVNAYDTRLTRDDAIAFLGIVQHIALTNNLVSKEQLLQGILQEALQNRSNSRFVRLSTTANRRLTAYTDPERIASVVTAAFMGERDFRGNIVSPGFRDFITLNSWVDETVVQVTGNTWSVAPRAPININTASTYVLANIFRGARSSSAEVTPAAATALADYIVAYRTPGHYLTEELKRKQDDLKEWIKVVKDLSPPDEVVYDPEQPRADEQIEDTEVFSHLSRTVHLLTDDVDAEDVELPRPFVSWAQFDSFLKLMTLHQVITKSQAEIIMANCNPNTHYSRLPARSGMRVWTAGKDQLTDATTELSFSSFGRFNVEMIIAGTRTIGSSKTVTIANENTITASVSNVRGMDSESTHQPDRLCFFDKDGKTLMVQPINRVQGSSIRVSRPFEPRVTTANIDSWSIQRVEAIQKYTAVVEYANVVRLATQEHFGTGSDVMVFPEPTLRGLVVGGIEREGYITLKRQPMKAAGANEWFRQLFIDRQGIAGAGSIFQGGKVFPHGAHLQPAGLLSFPFNTVLLPQPVNQPIAFTIGMWICLNRDADDCVNENIINTNAQGDFATKINLKVHNGQLSASLTGADAGFQSLAIAPPPIDVSDWKAGEWHWVGLAFQQRNPVTESSRAILFASTLDAERHVLEINKMSTATLMQDVVMRLYQNVPNRESFSLGQGDLVVDHIAVIGEFLPPITMYDRLYDKLTRWEPAQYVSAALTVSKSSSGQYLEYGTISWTEYPTAHSESSAVTSLSIRDQANKQLVGLTSADIDNTGKAYRLTTGPGDLENMIGDTDDTIKIQMNLNLVTGGSGDGIFETPWIDDITVTVFPPLQIHYWRQSSELKD